MVHLVTLFQAAQYGYGVFHRWLIHQHFLEAPLQRRILLDILAILIQRCRANAMQLATGQRRLKHVAGIHGTVSLASANHGMQLVNKQNDATFLLGQFIQHSLQALFEFASILCPGDQCSHIQ